MRLHALTQPILSSTSRVVSVQFCTAEAAKVKVFLAASWTQDRTNISYGDFQLYDPNLAFVDQAAMTSTIRPVRFINGTFAEWTMRLDEDRQIRCVQAGNGGIFRVRSGELTLLLEDGEKEFTVERKKGRRTFWEHHLSPHVAAARGLWELTKPITNLYYAKIPTFYGEYLRGRLGIPEVVETE
ncbi:hypothetical protein AKAW_07884 [Aspergillus luchuensis IFO 4308]|nr:hypothetical protein AKAW_07884 [Aspergillus luchuensis IFO 4308]